MKKYKITEDNFRLNKKNLLMASTILLTSLLNLGAIEVLAEEAGSEDIETAKEYISDEDKLENLVYKLKSQIKYFISEDLYFELLEKNEEITGLFEEAIVNHESEEWEIASEDYETLVEEANLSEDASELVSSLNDEVANKIILTDYLELQKAHLQNEDEIDAEELSNVDEETEEDYEIEALEEFKKDPFQASARVNFQNDFINKISPHAVRLGEEYGLYPSVMIAQAILESGWAGQATGLPDDYVLSKVPNYNLFGIKGDYNGERVKVKTKEESEDGKLKPIYAYFRKYPSYEHSMIDYAEKLKHNTTTKDPYFYSGVWIENTKTYKDATDFLTGRWATDSSYGVKLNKIIKDYSLTKYDVSDSFGTSGSKDEDPSDADKLYKEYKDAHYVSERWELAIEFNSLYPTDSRAKKVINDEADTTLSYAMERQRLGDYKGSIKYYNRLLDEKLVKTSIKERAKSYKELAEQNKKITTANVANELYKKYEDAYYVSERWELAIEFNSLYPTDSRAKKIINDEADTTLSYAMERQRLGDYKGSIKYYNRLLDEKSVEASIKERAKSYKELAEQNKKITTANDLYKEYQEAYYVSDRWDLAVKFNSLYSTDSRAKKIINDEADTNLSYAMERQRLGDYKGSIKYYNRLLDEKLVEASIKERAKDYKELAEQNKKIATANDLYKEYQEAYYVSDRWDLAVKFNSLYSTDSRAKKIINNEADTTLSYARNLERTGNKLRAKPYYEKVRDEPSVDVSIRHLARVYLKKLSPIRKRVVYIDPGHGGTDPGTVQGGITEKKLNLQVSQKLIKELESMGYFVKASRETDTFISLPTRANESNADNADIFISVHHNNSGAGGKARGIETFVHHRVASGFGQETNRKKFKMEDPRIRDSVKLADSVHNNLVGPTGSTGLRSRGVKGNNFSVLRNTFSPAILVELGFMDNPTELSIIKSAAYQKKASKSIAQGVEKYFRES